MESKGSFDSVMNRLESGDAQAASDVYGRYAIQLVELAQRRLQKKYQAKFDADDVVQSAFHSFFQRHRAGQFELESWENIWALLASITIRKCGRKIQSFQSAKRDVQREAAAPVNAPEPGQSREPTPEDAALLEETLDQLMNELTPEQQRVLILKLQNFSNEEISDQIGRTERTVYRVLTLIRCRLEEIDGSIEGI